MIEKKVRIKNVTGLDLGPAGVLCETAIPFRSRLAFTYAGGTGNLKSILSILGASISCGDEIVLHCEGPDEEEALQALVEAIEKRLGE